MITKKYLYYLEKWQTFYRKGMKLLYTFLRILVFLLVFIHVFLFIILKMKKLINLNQIVKSKTLILLTKIQSFV